MAYFLRENIFYNSNLSNFGLDVHNRRQGTKTRDLKEKSV